MLTRSGAGGSLDVGSAGTKAATPDPKIAPIEIAVYGRCLIRSVIHTSSRTLNFAWIALALSSISEASSLSEPAMSSYLILKS